MRAVNTIKEAVYQQGEIIIAECTKYVETFPVFIFVADTDMVTDGCIALTGTDNSIVLTMHNHNESIEEVEARVGSNHRVVSVTYKHEPNENKSSFQDFLKTHKPPTEIYTCIYCGGNSKVLKCETKQQFLSYGNIKVMNGCEQV